MAMPSKAVLPVIADVNTAPSVRKVATSVTPEPKARAVRARSTIVRRSLRGSTAAIVSLLVNADWGRGLPLSREARAVSFLAAATRLAVRAASVSRLFSLVCCKSPAQESLCRRGEAVETVAGDRRAAHAIQRGSRPVLLKGWGAKRGRKRLSGSACAPHHNPRILRSAQLLRSPAVSAPRNGL